MRGSEPGEERRQVAVLVEVFGLPEEGIPPRLDTEQLVQVKDLQAVVVRLGADVGVVADDFDVAPASGGCLRVEPADVLEIAVLGDLDEANTVPLPNDSKLSAIWGGPSPNIVAGFGGGGQILLAE